jgi:hypothetical protein
MLHTMAHLAGTLMTFSIVVLDALRTLDTSFGDADADAYFHAWNYVGHVMGIDERLMTDGVDDGRALWVRIAARDWEASPEGRAMTKALVGAMEHATPGTLFDGFASYCVRHLGGERAPFDIPQELARRWNVQSAADVLS